MATTSICATLKNGKDLSCIRPTSKYFQEICLINFNDIDKTTVVAPWTANYNVGNTCKYSGEFSLLTGKTGYKFKFPDKGSAIFASMSVATDANGYSIFTHHINALLASITEADKCVLDALSKGLVVAAIQFQDGTVEIYGLRYGLKMDDTTIDPANNGGVTPVVLSSREGAEESHLALVYSSSDPTADFDACFENIA
jgi:hypothetical protein